MAMDPTYQPFYTNVRALKFRVKDALDMPDHASARALMDQIQRLEDELEMHKNPRDLEGRTKLIMELLARARSQPNSFMSVGDAVALYDTFEEMRRSLRRHPAY
jgi:hypothetical protein